MNSITHNAELDRGEGNIEKDAEKTCIIMCVRQFAEEVKEILKEADVALQSIIKESDGKLVSELSSSCDPSGTTYSAVMYDITCASLF